MTDTQQCIGNMSFAQAFGRPQTNERSFAASFEKPQGSCHPVLWRRFLSGCIDSAFLTLLIPSLYFVAMNSGIITQTDLNSLSNLFLLKSAIILLGSSFLYGFVMEASRHHGTLGKIATKTRVMNRNGTPLTIGDAFLRNLTKPLSLMTAGLSYFMIFATKNRQSLHDMLVDTIVIHK